MCSLGRVAHHTDLVNAYLEDHQTYQERIKVHEFLVAMPKYTDLARALIHETLLPSLGDVVVALI